MLPELVAPGLAPQGHLQQDTAQLLQRMSRHDKGTVMPEADLPSAIYSMVQDCRIL